jgi:prepilin-type N-terminal cleavage/methylation domain-containing protein
MKNNKKKKSNKKIINNEGERGFGLVELMIVIAILAFIVDVSMPKVQSYISHKKEEQNNSAVLEVAVTNIKTYVNQVDQSLAFHNKSNGSYYIKDVGVTLSGSVPTDDSWIVIANNKVTEGMFKEPCGDDYAYVSYDGEDYEVLKTTKLTEKP